MYFFQIRALNPDLQIRTDKLLQLKCIKRTNSHCLVSFFVVTYKPYQSNQKNLATLLSQFNSWVKKKSFYSLYKLKTFVKCLASNLRVSWFSSMIFLLKFLVCVSLKKYETTMENFSVSPKYDDKHWAIILSIMKLYNLADITT